MSRVLLRKKIQDVGQAHNLLEQLKYSPACYDFAASELEYLDQITGYSR